ncbi:MAG: IS30 family transposase, partial [Actinomycetota bacterium]|nr:IS30 family transposase [Actinomycetota bacterium]
VCSGASVASACLLVGASRMSGDAWWRQSAGMRIQAGREGGLALVPAPEQEWVGDKLTALDRDTIAAGLIEQVSLTEIGRRIGRHASTVSREVKRNSGPDGSYYPSVAGAKAFERSRRPKPFMLAQDPQMCQRIEAWMDQGWSPRLISEVLKRDAGGDHTAWVSHETIYQALYVQARGSLRADLHRQLSTKRSARRSRTATRRGTSIYAEAFTISQRPAEVADRAVPGHWEGDLILGGAGSGSAIGTLVERSTRFTILLHLPGRHTADAVAAAMIDAMGGLPGHLRRSITWDRGSELAGYRDIQLALKTPVYFCDPHSPWQRGSNENTNRLLRHWFEKGSDLSLHTAADLRRVQDSLNARPRPTLGLKTPAQALNELLDQAA